MIFSGLQFLARELLARAEEELYDEDKIHHEMTEAYASLDAGGISEEEFDRREKLLMERLETIEARRVAAAGGGDDDDEEDGEGGDAAESGDELEDEEDDESGSEVHYGVFDDDEDEDDGFDPAVQDRVQAHASRRAP
jgi:Gas vesicle protein G